MAPLGVWSLEATVLVGARGMPGTVVSLNRVLSGDIPVAVRSPSNPRTRRRADRALGGLGVEAALPHRVAIALGQRAQLPQGKRSPSAARRNVDAGPQPFGAR